MLLARKFKLKPAPTQQQIDRDMTEFNDRLLPMLNNQLENTLYFCGEVITGYDLQVYCELNSISLFAENMIDITAHKNVSMWMQRIDIIPEVDEVEKKFKLQGKKLLNEQSLDQGKTY